MSEPETDSSPPPYSPTPPNPITFTSAQRASSTPQFHPSSARQVHYRSHPSSSAALTPATFTSPCVPSLASQGPTSGDETDETSASEDGMVYTGPSFSLASSLRSRLLRRKGPGHDDRPRPITTAANVPGATETETESDSPRNLPTARLTRPALTTFTPFSCPPWVFASLFAFSRLLSIVPAVVGTLWNLYHLIWPPTRPGPSTLSWRVDFFVSILWSVLTGWQCLQLTTGVLKRWRVYYSPFATLIRLFALQAICWPATHITLTLLNHEQRPALCWAVIGTTTCYSRSIQLWVTSNIGPAPAPAPRIAQPTSPSPLRRSLLASASGMRDEWIRLRRRRWDWNEVNRKCVLPAGVIYFVMAWAEMLRREWEVSRCG